MSAKRIDEITVIVFAFLAGIMAVCALVQLALFLEAPAVRNFMWFMVDVCVVTASANVANETGKQIKDEKRGE